MNIGKDLILPINKEAINDSYQWITQNYVTAYMKHKITHTKVVNAHLVVDIINPTNMKYTTEYAALRNINGKSEPKNKMLINNNS